MADKNTAPVENAAEVAEVKEDSKPKNRQIAASFTPDEVARITEAQFVKRHLKATDLVRAAVLAYIADVELPAAK